MDKEILVRAFNEWMRREINEWMRREIDGTITSKQPRQSVEEFRAALAVGQTPSYGQECVTYLEELAAELTAK
jgi:hypothetical protein